MNPKQKLNLTALVAALYAMYEATIGAAITRITSNGSSENVFLQTLRWTFWKANAESAGQNNDAFLETVPQSIRGSVRGAISKVEAYFSNEKYSAVPLAAMGVNALANAIRVLTGCGTNDQNKAFSFLKGQVAEGLLAIRAEIDAATEETHGYTKAQLADAFRIMPSAEAQAMYRFIDSTDTYQERLIATLRYYLAEGPRASTTADEDDDAATDIGHDDSVPRVLAGFHSSVPAAFSVVPDIAKQQAQQIAA